MRAVFRCVALAACLLAAASASSAVAENADRSWVVLKEAETAHDEGMQLRSTDPAASLAAFRRCVQAWERLRSAGAANGPLEFNLGNAYLEAGDTGRAIAAYLRAERFMPGNGDLERNLAHARTLAAGSVGSGSSTLLVDSVAQWWHIVPRGARTTTGWTCWWLFWGIVTVRALRPATGAARRVLRAATWASAAGWAVLGGSVVADEALARARPVAVVVEPEAVLRKGNGEGYERAIVEALGPGVEARLLERRPGWVRLGLPDGRSGWVRDSQVEIP